jgi:hypothetical protein
MEGYRDRRDVAGCIGENHFDSVIRRDFIAAPIFGLNVT